MNNPYGPDQRYALYPEPVGSAGHRLCHLILGLDTRAYLSSFHRRNTAAGKWSLGKGRESADDLFHEVPEGHTVVLLGREVWNAWRYRIFSEDDSKVWTPFQVVKGEVHTFVLLPHPSGLCRAWNDPAAYSRARQVLLRASPELTGVIPK